MPKYILLLIFLCLSIFTYAQSSLQQQPQQYIAITNQMKSSLNLNSTQTQQVQVLNQNRELQMEQIMQQRTTNKMNTNNSLNTVRSNYLNQLQGILTPEQWNIYTSPTSIKK